MRYQLFVFTLLFVACEKEPAPEQRLEVSIPRADGSEQPAFVMLPRGFEADGRERPLLVSLHSWSFGYEQRREDLEPVTMAEGWIYLFPDFRGRNDNPSACGSELAQQDILDAVEWAKREYPVDESRIYLVGTSGGGHMTLLMAAKQRFAFGSPVGAVTTDPIEDDRGLYVFRLAELLEPRVAPFEEVRERVQVLVEEERRRELARERLSSALASAGGQGLEAVAEAMDAVIDTTIEFTRESFVPGVGRRNAFVAAAFTTEPGSMTDLIESDRGFYVLEVLERVPADEATFAEQQDSIRQQLFLRKRQTLIAAWLDRLLAEAEIIDYRSGEGVPWEPEPSLLVYDTSS